MLSFEEARARVLEGAGPLGVERVWFTEAVGRVLAEDVVSQHALPAFDHSAMDGYAVAVDALAGDAPFRLRVSAESRTGGALPGPIAPGDACRIFTGARLPEGTDAVVMQEDVTREGDVAVLAARPKRGANVRRAGEDVSVGQVVLPRGTRVTPYATMLLASVERARLSVASRPRVAIVATGDELRDLGEAPRGGAVVDANAPTLAALVTMLGGAPVVLPRAADALDATRAVVRDALGRSDLVLTIGGVSVGTHDVVKEALAREGVEMDFWKVAIKPGKPVAMGRASRDGRPVRVLGLPGNPASAVLTFALFAAPLIRAMQGDAAPVPLEYDARLARPLKRAPGRTEFLRVRLAREGDGLVAHPLENQASGAVTSFAWADALARVPAEVAALDEGTVLRCTRLMEV